jgi:general secretion pathway protein F
MEGAILEGAVEATDEKSAIEKLKNTGIIPLKVTAPEEGIKKRISLRSSRSNLLTFSTELSALLSAGLPLDRSLNILSGISESKDMKNIIQSILKSIREGSSFSDALQRHPRVFPRLYISMIRAGEAGGVLDVVLDKLNEFLESAKALKDHIISVMIYPIFLVFASGLSIIILLTYVLPKFSSIFNEFGNSLPLSTQILLTLSNALKSYWWFLLLLVITGGLIFKHQIKSERGGYKWDAFKALNNAKDVISNQVMASAIDSVSEGAKEGKGIAVPLSDANVFPPLALSMIKVGEETGQLDNMLLKVATTYEKSLNVAIKRFVSILEPVMILGMGLIIGFIVISMLMAIFSITELPF